MLHDRASQEQGSKAMQTQQESFAMHTAPPVCATFGCAAMPHTYTEVHPADPVALHTTQGKPYEFMPAGFDIQDWYKQLFEYGLNGDASASGNGSDPDEELVPRLVTQLVLPLAAHSLQHAWNPHSRRSTAAAKAMLEDLLIYVPPEDPKLQVLLQMCQHARGWESWCIP